MVLPEFISSAIETRNTSIGDNKVFGDKYTELITELINDRYSQVMRSVEEKFGYVPTINESAKRLSMAITKAVEIEKPLRNQLETLCEAVVNQTLGVPQETVLLECRLVDEIKPDRELRIVPEFNEHPEYQFSDVSIDKNGEILKRRFIDSMVQGISYLLMTATYDSDELRKWSDELPGLYDEIITLNDYLLFAKEETITDDNPMLGSYVETDIHDPDDKIVINAQGLVYPLLLQETYRGFFEAFATHALPDKLNEALYVIRRSDFTMAEAWDLRLGVPIWQKIDRCLPDDIEPSTYPYLFTTLMYRKDFNRTMYDVLTHVEGTIDWINDVLTQVEHDKEYQLFKNDVERFNFEKCLVTDENNEDENIISS
jgi:hypothetical protein